MFYFQNIFCIVNIFTLREYWKLQIFARTQYIYRLVRGSSGGINQASVVLWKSPGATCFRFSFNCKYPDTFWTLGSDQVSFKRSRYQGKEDSLAASNEELFAKLSFPHPNLGCLFGVGRRNAKSQNFISFRREPVT